MSNAALWGEQIGHQLTTARANAQIAQANRELQKAESFHCGSVAVLAAALNELRELSPNHPLLFPAVRTSIYEDGMRAGGFDEAWGLEHDPKKILRDLQHARATAVAELLPMLERELVKERAGGFLWLSKRFHWWGDRYKNKAQAERTRDLVLQSLRTGTIDDPYDADGLKRAAWQEVGVG
jgi:hypothetical protein